MCLKPLRFETIRHFVFLQKRILAFEVDVTDVTDTVLALILRSDLSYTFLM